MIAPDPGPRRAAHARWIAAGRPPGGPSLDVLAISNGGAHGAFAAGLLAGWTEAGGRPPFEVVTGVSVGALIAPFAFVGPGWDGTLEQAFTRVGRPDLGRLDLAAALRGALGLVSPARLRARIAELVDARLIEAIATEHRLGRRLLVGTTNLDAGRPVVWDLGALAARGEAALLRAVLLASAAVPGALPPVPVEVECAGRRCVELHADGALTRTTLTGGIEAARDSPALAATLWVIQNNALLPGYEPVRPSIRAVAARALTTLIRRKGDADLVAAWLAAREGGAAFRLAFLPPGHRGGAMSNRSAASMSALFETGRAQALRSGGWLGRPPALMDRRDLAPAPATGPAR